MKISRILLLMTVSILCSCNEDDKAPALVVSTAIEDKFGQEADSFVVGDDVVVRVKIQNPGASSIVIEFTAPLVSVTVYSEDGSELVFDPNSGISFPQVVQETTIEALDEILHTLVWNGVDSSGMQVGPARYQVVVRVSAAIKGGNVVLYSEVKAISLF